MKKRLFVAFTIVLVAVLTTLVAVVFFLSTSTDMPSTTLQISRGQSLRSVAQTLENRHIVRHRVLFLLAAQTQGLTTVRAGTYTLPENASPIKIAQRLQQPPETVSIRIPEGMTLTQMRHIIDQRHGITHDTAELSNQALWQKIAPENEHDMPPEGRFFPDTYIVDTGAPDIQIYRAAFKRMNDILQAAWDNRSDNLPYRSPYEMLIAASLIEKETGRAEDRAAVSSVFANRLRIGMKLQTDPSVIYGMGDKYQGKIRKTDLQSDTPYNTYTRYGLPPTPIALPGRAAIEAAAHPDKTDFLYFVAKGDGYSHFSRTLSEHNAAVRRYILKQETP